MLTKAMQAVVYGDVFMRVLYATRPYEKVPGSANSLHEKWKEKCIESLSRKSPDMMAFSRNIKGIIRDFDNLPRNTVQKPKVGIVGEILVKFSPLANNHIVELLESEGAEAVMPDLMDFLLYCFYNNNFKAQNLGGKKTTAALSNMGISLLEYFRRTAKKELLKSKHVIKELRKAYPDSNIIAVDYDPGASEVNQLNRIKLMLSTAQKNMRRGENPSETV